MGTATRPWPENLAAEGLELRALFTMSDLQEAISA
jgi:hypothetical protein